MLAGNDKGFQEANPNISVEELQRLKGKASNHPCKFVNLCKEFELNFSTASKNLLNDGFIHQLVQCDKFINSNVDDMEINLSKVDQWTSVQIINRFMMKYNHRLYNGHIYTKPDKG